MDQVFPAMIMGFREGLEAFLLVAIILNYLSRTGRQDLRASVFRGSFASILLSASLGVLVYALAAGMNRLEAWAKIWESVARLLSFHACRHRVAALEVRRGASSVHLEEIVPVYEEDAASWRVCVRTNAAQSGRPSRAV